METHPSVGLPGGYELRLHISPSYGNPETHPVYALLHPHREHPESTQIAGLMVEDWRSQSSAPRLLSREPQVGWNRGPRPHAISITINA